MCPEKFLPFFPGFSWPSAFCCNPCLSVFHMVVGKHEIPVIVSSLVKFACCCLDFPCWWRQNETWVIKFDNPQANFIWFQKVGKDRQHLALMDARIFFFFVSLFLFLFVLLIFKFLKSKQWQQEWAFPLFINNNAKQSVDELKSYIFHLVMKWLQVFTWISFSLASFLASGNPACVPHFWISLLGVCLVTTVPLTVWFL